MLIRSPLKKRGKQSLRESKITPDIESKLQRFWSAVASGRRILPLLIQYAAIEGKKRASRYNFERIKHRYKIAGQVCLVCGEPAEIRHHIIALGQGGPNCKANIAALCNRCHSLIHPHLQDEGRAT